MRKMCMAIGLLQHKVHADTSRQIGQRSAPRGTRRGPNANALRPALRLQLLGKEGRQRRRIRVQNRRAICLPPPSLWVSPL